MKLISIFAAVGSLFVASLGMFVYLQNRGSSVVRAFSLFCLSFFIWLFTYSFGFSIHNEQYAILWFKAGYIGVIFIPLTIYSFIAAFLGNRKRSVIYLTLTLCCIFVILLLSSTHLISGLYRYPWGSYPKAGPLHPIFLMFFFTVFSSFYILLPRAYLQRKQETQVLESKRTLYLFWALVVGNCASLDFVPNYGYGILPLGFVFMITMIGIFSYAILAYQFLDIEVIVKRTLVFAGLSLGVLGAVALMTFVTQDLLVHYVTIPKLFSNLLAASLIAGFYNPLRTWLVNVTDRYLFQKNYDYKELLKKFTDEVMVMVDLKQLVQKTVSTLAETVKLDNCTLLLLDKDKRTYELAASKGINGQQIVLEEQEPFITFLRETHEPIGQDGKVRFPEAVTNRLKQLNARLCLPLNLHEDLIGVLCLGKKKSDEEFTKDDLDILLPLARTLAIAVSNAQLFVELARTQAEAAQKEKLAVIGTLSAGINHEICNPLGIVKAQCEAFLLDLEDGILIGKSSQDVLERTSTIMRTALKQIDRATAITQKLSNFAKPIKEPTTQPVSVPQEVDEVLMLVGHDLKLEKIEVVKDLQPDLPSIIVDRRQLQEVLFNLIRNAGQAIQPPGTIWVRGRTAEGQVRIEIADTGSGIPPDKLSKIYDPFFTTKDPGKGTGLGLFIVRQIVERNRGRISVESTVGKGTIFYLDFPIGKGAAIAAR